MSHLQKNGRQNGVHHRRLPWYWRNDWSQVRQGWSQRKLNNFVEFRQKIQFLHFKVVIAAKTTEPHPKLPGTIYTAAQKSK